MAMTILKMLQGTATTSSAMNGLRYIHITRDLMEVVVCFDASFAVNPDRSPQLGILTIPRSMMDGTVNIIHFTSTKSKRVCKSVFAAELFAFKNSYDIGQTISHSLGELYGRKVNLTIYMDSHSLYGLCISLAHTTERRLQIDLAMIRKPFERRDITDTIWIKGESSSADDLTKEHRRSEILSDVVEKSRFLLKIQRWIKRVTSDVKTTNNQ